MPSKNTTTVVLTDSAQVVKDDLAPIFGLKNILSAGLMLFAGLTDQEMIDAVGAVNGKPDVDIDIGRTQRVLDAARTHVERLLAKERRPIDPSVHAAPGVDIEKMLAGILKKMQLWKRMRPQVDVAALKTLVHRYVRDALQEGIVADAEVDEAVIGRKMADK